jgi:chitin disaccharide deacetylase
MVVIFHADDFGITLDQSKRILECCSGVPGGHGLLNSLSILANSPHFEECAELLDARPKSLRVGVHLNFVEGPCVADPTQIPMLVDERGMFKLGYGGLLAASALHGAELARQVEIEAAAQVERVVGRFPELAGALRLDGHQHTHLIPAVFRGVLAVASRPEYTLEYLRIPAEPAAPFKAAGVAGSIEPINRVKRGLLNYLWGRDRRAFESAGLGSFEEKSAVFCGLSFSGHMDAERVSAVYPHLRDVAEKRGCALELLFHPGRVAAPELCLNPELPGFVEFSCGEGRDVEHDALQSAELAAAAGADA